MRPPTQVIAALVLFANFLPAEEIPDNWHQWRGPEANGVSKTAKPPLTWSAKENIQWKAPLDGFGTTTPIVWGDQVFVLTAINTGKVDPSLPKPEEQPKRVFGIKHPNTSYKFEVIALTARPARSAGGARPPR